MAAKTTVITFLLFTCVAGSYAYGEIFNISAERINKSGNADLGAAQMSYTYYYEYRQSYYPGAIAAITLGVCAGVFLIIGLIIWCICGGPKVIPGRVLQFQPYNSNQPQNQQMYPQASHVSPGNYGPPQPNTYMPQYSTVGPQVHGDPNMPPPAYDNTKNFSEKFE